MAKDENAFSSLGAPAAPRVAVVIGAIGVRAAGAIALFEMLDEAQVKPDLLIGSSGGAWLAAMRGAGFTTAQMHEAVRAMQQRKFYSQLDFRTLLGLAHPKLARPGIGSALHKPHRQQALARKLFGTRRVEDLHPPTILQSADCVAGEPIELTSGPLADAVYAASALCPYYPPLPLDGRWLVDGAYVAPVPILEAVKRHADVIIAFFHEEEPKAQPADLLEANYNILAAYFSRLLKDQTMLAIELHHHEIMLVPLKLDSYVGPWETAALPQVLAAGQRAVARQRTEILTTIRQFKRQAA